VTRRRAPRFGDPAAGRPGSASLSVISPAPAYGHRSAVAHRHLVQRLHPGTPVGGTLTRVVEQIGFFAGLGVVIVFLAALALGRLSVVGIRDGTIPAGTLPPQPEPAGSGSGTP